MTTVKQIIIDGVDVSGCKHYGFQENCTIRAHQKCSNCPNCYYKQLVRKTQECEEKQEIIDELASECKRISSNYTKDEDRYKQALEKIGEKVKKEIVCDDCNLIGTKECDSALCESFYLDDFCRKLLPIIDEVKDGTED